MIVRKPAGFDRILIRPASVSCVPFRADRALLHLKLTFHPVDKRPSGEYNYRQRNINLNLRVRVVTWKQRSKRAAGGGIAAAAPMRMDLRGRSNAKASSNRRDPRPLSERLACSCEETSGCRCINLGGTAGLFLSHISIEIWDSFLFYERGRFHADSGFPMARLRYFRRTVNRLT